MVTETKEMVVSTGELYRTLSEASETLFLQIWQEREKYDTKTRNYKMMSKITGGATGAVFGKAVSGAVGKAVSGAAGKAVSGAAGKAVSGAAGKAVSGAVGKAVAGAALGNAAGFIVGAIAVFGFGGVGAIVGAKALNSIVKTFYEPKAAGKMEKATQKCIEQFKEEVGHTRVRMVEQVSAQIMEIFEKELVSVDGCFTDFRMSVNIDEKKIPLLEQKLLETEKILKQIDTIERERG